MQETFTLVGMWATMGWIARGVVILLAVMSVYSLGLAFERAWRFHQAKKQSLELAMRITPLLESHRLDDAIDLTQSKDYRVSHIGRVLGSGLQKYRSGGSAKTDEAYDVVESSKRALEREMLMATADMKRGLGNLATISTTACPRQTIA